MNQSSNSNEPRPSLVPRSENGLENESAEETPRFTPPTKPKRGKLSQISNMINDLREINDNKNAYQMQRSVQQLQNTLPTNWNSTQVLLSYTVAQYSLATPTICPPPDPSPSTCSSSCSQYTTDVLSPETPYNYYYIQIYTRTYKLMCPLIDLLLSGIILGAPYISSKLIHEHKALYAKGRTIKTDVIQRLILLLITMVTKRRGDNVFAMKFVNSFDTKSEECFCRKSGIQLSFNTLSGII
ncbi:unnamed protein product [Leptidea sinapis]|uniref:Uncharacterized protein n=1 Tax=Leptidea sinapis TaxID=189913 RepID=A0A5E4PR55_9NEOP|nr:unnamed protein product [Leptidea sinapis]